MKHRVWTLITGQIRSELYFRVLLVKLCDLRSRGIIEEIVYSTWDDEVDKFSGLRDQLRKLSVIVVEHPMPDKKIEGKSNPMGYEFQRTTLWNGCSVIPQECFVMKVRTDLNQGVCTLFDFVTLPIEMIEKYMAVNHFGSFPVMYEKKLVMQAFNTRHLLFCNDRFFLGKRNDIKKLCYPIATLKARKYPIYYENALLNGCAYYFFSLLGDSWNIITVNFYNALQKYCAFRQENNLIVPRMILRLYAMICVYIHTHVFLLENVGSKKFTGPYSLLGLIKGEALSNEMVEKIVSGDLISSNISNVFKDELRKISLNFSSIHGYTFEEYEELRKFVIDELKNPGLIGEYPFFKRGDDDNIKFDRKYVVNILMHKYNDNYFVEKISDCIDDSYNSFSENIFSKFATGEVNKKLYIEMLKASVYDCDREAIAKYVKAIVDDVDYFDSVTLDHALKYLTIMILSYFRDESSIVAVSYFIEIFNKREVYKIEFTEFESRLNLIVDKLCQNLLKGKYHKPVRKKVEFVEMLLNKIGCAVDFLDIDDLEIVKALTVITSGRNVIPSNVIGLLKRQKEKDVLRRIEGNYAESFRKGDLAIPADLELFIKNNDTEKVLSYAKYIGGKVANEAILKYIWRLQLNFTKNIIHLISFDMINKAVEKISQGQMKNSFLVRVNRFLIHGHLSVSKEDVEDHESFLILLETLYHRNVLNQNKDSLLEMCFEDYRRIVYLQAFLRLEADKCLEFFSMKNGCEIWVYYVPYLKNDKSKTLEVYTFDNGRSWPGADLENHSAFAAYIKIIEDSLYVSIEMCSRNIEKALSLVEIAGLKSKKRHGASIPLLTNSIPIKRENVSLAVNEAMDEVCRVGENLVKALG